MSMKSIVVYLVLFLISLGIVYWGAKVPFRTALRVAAMTAFLKGSAVLFLDEYL